MANPTAFERATRVRHTVDQLMAHFKIQEQWPVEGAAMLSQIGCIALPAAMVDKLYKGEVSDDSEREMVKRMPTVAEKCLAHIPRIDSVRKILQQHSRHFAEDKKHSDGDLDEEIPWGARAPKKNALDFDLLDSGENHSDHPFAIMRGREGWSIRKSWRLLQRCGKLAGKTSDAGAFRP